jgi:hypothetical protein
MMFRIPYNPQTDPGQYAMQFLQNLLGGILQQQQQQQQQADFADIANWARGGFQGQVPTPQTPYGQQFGSNVVANMPRFKQAKGVQSDYQKMLDNGLTPEQAKKALLIQYKLVSPGEELTEKDVNSILNTLHQALKATYDNIGDPLPGPQMQKNRERLNALIGYYSSKVQQARGEAPRKKVESKEVDQKTLDDVNWNWRGNTIKSKAKALPANDPLGLLTE